MNHPEIPMRLVERPPFIIWLRSSLEAELGTETYAAVYKHGKTLQLEGVVAELLAHLDSSGNSPATGA